MLDSILPITANLWVLSAAAFDTHILDQLRKTLASMPCSCCSCRCSQRPALTTIFYFFTLWLSLSWSRDVLAVSHAGACACSSKPLPSGLHHYRRSLRLLHSPWPPCPPCPSNLTS